MADFENGEKDDFEKPAAPSPKALLLTAFLERAVRLLSAFLKLPPRNNRYGATSAETTSENSAFAKGGQNAHKLKDMYGVIDFFRTAKVGF